MPTTKGYIDPVFITVACVSPPATDATPNTPANIPWDTFYDLGGATVGSLPAGLGMSYSSGTLTLTGSGVWVFNLMADIEAAPGSVGSLRLWTDNSGSEELESIPIAASGNPSLLTLQRTWALSAGNQVRVQQASAGSSVAQIDGYIQMQIIRLARNVV